MLLVVVTWHLMDSSLLGNEGNITKLSCQEELGGCSRFA